MDRLDRLEAVQRLLRDRPGMTAGELARELGTSARSVFRDVARLRERGVPVESSRGRGGGLRLHPRWGLGRVLFSPEEAVSALLSLAVAEALALPMFGRELRPARQKIVAAFPTAERQRLGALRARILVGPGASAEVTRSWVAPDGAVTRAVQAAFVRERQVELEYRRADGEQSRRRVEPHAILLQWPAWYVLGYDHLRAAVRTFRLDRVVTARVLPESFRPRVRELLKAMGEARIADLDAWRL